jgi:hypothetical protein
MAIHKLSATVCSRFRRIVRNSRGGYVINPLSGKRIYATSPTAKKLARDCSTPRGRSAAKPPLPRKMKFRKNQPKEKRFKGDRPSPGESATLYREGTVRTGNDGNRWKIKVSGSGVHRWVRLD